MSWRRRLRDIAMAGGLAGCTAQVVAGGTTSGTTSGSGGTTTSNPGMGGVPPIPPCNANPDPCCMCSYTHYGYGGFGGASCVGTTGPLEGGNYLTCADELACLAAPTTACCAAFTYNITPALARACADAGPGPADAGSD